MRMNRAILGIGLGTLLSSFACPGNIKISYQQVWPDVAPKRGLAPVIVEITNSGNSTQGLLKYSSRGQVVQYPVELPKGAMKQITLFAEGNSFEATLELSTQEGTLSSGIELKNSTPGDVPLIGIISSSPVGLSTLRTRIAKKAWFDSTIRPELAPHRSIGYEGFDCIVLGRGSERIPDAAVEGLKRYVLRGGQLIVCGGASPLVLRDARWKGFWPLEAQVTKNIDAHQAFQSILSTNLVGDLSLASGPVQSGSKILVTSQGNPVIVRKNVGVGIVDVLAFDAFEDPIRTWAGRDGLFRILLTRGSSQFGDGILENDLLSGYSNDSGYRGRYGSYESSQVSNPFEVELIPPGQIFALLFSFFIVAVPINFFVLGKLRRKELSWVTLPIISMVFAGFIFSMATRLYSMKDGRASVGILVVQDKEPTAVYVGTEQFFFAKGGTFDLGFHGAESLTTPMQYDRSMRVRTNELGVIDAGECLVPALQVSNLAFREYRICQSYSANWTINLNDIHPETWVPGKKISGTIENKSPLKLKDSVFWFKGQNFAVGEINPGGSKQFSFVCAPPKPRNSNFGVNTVNAPCALTAQIEVKVGGTHGEVVNNGSGVKLLYTYSLGETN